MLYNENKLNLYFWKKIRFKKYFSSQFTVSGKEKSWEYDEEKIMKISVLKKNVTYCKK